MQFNIISEGVIEFTDLKFNFFENLKKDGDSWEYWGRANDTAIGSIRYFKRNNSSDLNTVNELSEITKSCLKKYFEIYNINFSDYSFNDNIYHIKKWDFPMHGMNSHRDADPTQKNSPSFTICGYFNEDYSGGELEFEDLNLFFKPKANSIIIFPSLTFHSVKDVSENNRYMYSVFIYKK
jgi:hypothetical protein